MFSRVLFSIAVTGCAALIYPKMNAAQLPQWQLGPFERAEEANPIITPSPQSTFFCPMQNKEVRWECDHTFNPGAVMRGGKVYLLYRAEDDYGTGIGKHTSRLGLAESSDGIHFIKRETPVLYPAPDDQSFQEFPGGCEDPRIVDTEEGTYVMTYTQWNQEVAVLGVATSDDLVNWEKHGYAFNGHFERKWSKSGSIICRCVGDRLIATKINGQYWMYWGEGSIYGAVSDNLISWKPLVDENGDLVAIIDPRNGKFDSQLVEPGPPAILTQEGILLLYNGKNSDTAGDPNITPRAYSAGQVLLDPDNPAKVIARSDDCFLTPERPYEMYGQYSGGPFSFRVWSIFKDDGSSITERRIPMSLLLKLP